MMVMTGLAGSPLPAVARVCQLAPLVIAPIVAVALGVEVVARRWRSRRDAEIAERCWALPPFTARVVPPVPPRVLPPVLPPVFPPLHPMPPGTLRDPAE